MKKPKGSKAAARASRKTPRPPNQHRRYVRDQIKKQQGKNLPKP